MIITMWHGERLGLGWEPSKYKTKGMAARGLYRALCEACRTSGMDSASEVWIKSPDESEKHGYVGKAWHVCWESGPMDWGCAIFTNEVWGYCETHWGFDLAFHE
jgi:hypothetical protein